MTTAVTPEVFILQVDLLTSCTTDLKSDQYKCVMTEDLAALDTQQQSSSTTTTKSHHFCPLYQIIFNVARFATSKRW